MINWNLEPSEIAKALLPFYIEVMEFAEREEDDNNTSWNLSDDSLEKAKKDLTELVEYVKFNIQDFPSDESERLAYDFWLTRNHHGAGYWDGDWNKIIGEKLTQYAHSVGECYCYRGDDGLIYLS